ncbi:MAG: AbrB/MazE/SpoVT family DNA-binding domain-containing protein [Acidobacteriota bacterium]
MEVVVVTTKGQIVIPAEVRRTLGVRKGSRLAVEERKGTIILRPLTREHFLKLSGVARGWGLLDALSRVKVEDRKREEAKVGRRTGSG